ncbi:hypothetical protein Pflav_000920 [Phytohabitans flavus]|uniref:Uncharacterized protein n=1 Tax=Phytohabitans flavus TaxID=1076124 RepID=A0A6F8XIP5_9ACTN|nr:hypothetical protein Pflav_000920 [Phytohabitans flavus]
MGIDVRGPAQVKECEDEPASVMGVHQTGQIHGQLTDLRRRVQGDAHRVAVAWATGPSGLHGPTTPREAITPRTSVRAAANATTPALKAAVGLPPSTMATRLPATAATRAMRSAIITYNDLCSTGFLPVIKGIYTTAT